MVVFRSDQESPSTPIGAAAAARDARSGIRADNEVASLADRRPPVASPGAGLRPARLEPGEVLRVLGEMVVPTHGTWLAVGLTASIAETAFGISTTGDRARLVLVELFHAEAELAPLLRTSLSEFPFGAVDSGGAGFTLQAAGLRLTVGLGQDAYPLLRLAAETAHALTVPLAARDRVLGAMTIGAPAGAALEREMLADLGRRAATALERAFTYTNVPRGGAEEPRPTLGRGLAGAGWVSSLESWRRSPR